MIELELKKIIAELPNHVGVSRENLTPAMIEQAGLYAFYAVAHARAMRDERTAKLALENLEAMARRELSRDKNKVTEAMISEFCHHDLKWVAKAKEHNEAEYCADVLGAVVRTFEHRKEMLVNLGATFREEMRSIEIRTPEKPRDRYQESQRVYQPVSHGGDDESSNSCEHKSGFDKDGHCNDCGVRVFKSLNSALYAIGSKPGTYVLGPEPAVQTLMLTRAGEGLKVFKIADADGPISPPVVYAVARNGKWVLNGREKESLLSRFVAKQEPMFKKAEIPF